MPSNSPAAPGFSFSDGKLRIFGEDSVMVITGWPEPTAVRRTSRRQLWQHFVPDFRLVRPYRPSRKKSQDQGGEESQPAADQLAFGFFDEAISQKPLSLLPIEKQRRKAFDGFRFSLPKPIAAALEPFRSHQWLLLLLLRYDESAVDLVKQNPALAFLLAQKMNGDAGLIRSLECGSMRQRDLLKSLDLPSSPSAVKLFRKIKPGAINGENWESIVATVRTELDRPKPRLVHLPVINSGVLEILNHPQAADAASQNLLEEVANDKSENYRARIVHLISNTLRMSAEMNPHHRLGLFQSIRRLREIHDRITEDYHRRVQRLKYVSNFDSSRFKNPPVEGISGKIEPITSPEGLVDEGESQGNCVASYVSRVEQGDTFIYRVLIPERCTLSIVRAPDGQWRIGQLESKFNTDARSETEEFVEAWLERHRISV
ncbi:MAG: hypothetical protein HKN23_12545 [Verrucomicrobiales bacterium]|nr:hypothetical protein [Verrucomicrobiales bacterium]